MRSVIMRALAIFIIVTVIIGVVAFYSFTTEIRRSILTDKQKQLAAVEETISARMEEVISIAYNIGNDPAFYLEPVDDDPNSGRLMSEMLDRYLVGNSFIEHLAFCRAAEPDRIIICTGERSLSEFFSTSFGMDEETAKRTIKHIHSENKTVIKTAGEGDNAYFSYSYPLPQLVEKPLAHVLMMMPVKEVKPLLQGLFINGNGVVAVFDADGNEIYSTGNVDDELDLADFAENGDAEENRKSSSGRRYVFQKVTSETNGWTYISVMRHSDTLSGLANKQIAFLAVILLVLAAAIIFMLSSIISQYKPISTLAAQVADEKQSSDSTGRVIDERALLKDRIASLKDDSEQKQKYETAFYEAEAASKAKSAFLSSMSHDIRTPMNAIIGMTAIARKHINDSEYVDECLKKVQLSSDYLLDIINNVLDMSRIESGRIPIAEETVVIPALIDSVVSLMTSSAEAKSQTLEVDIEELQHSAVIGDNIHIVQVFVNILSNAVKFTPEKGRIMIGVRQTDAQEAESGTYEFTFADTGIGIPPEFIDSVFDTFSRADGSAVSETEGTGLGMAIAKKLVELMGGTISCKSVLGEGTVFSVVMNMKYADESCLTERVSGTEQNRNDETDYENDVVDLTGKRIMLVEDNAMNRMIANKIITETGADIVETRNGKEAVEVFARSPEGYFDLILMDIQMPVMNGYQAAAAIRVMDRADAAALPIYAMTANPWDEDGRNVKDAGMNGHIGKPYSPTKLYKLLSQVLS